MTEKDNEALAAIQELHSKDIDASKARDFETLLSLWTEDGVRVGIFRRCGRNNRQRRNNRAEGKTVLKFISKGY